MNDGNTKKMAYIDTRGTSIPVPGAEQLGTWTGVIETLIDALGGRTAGMHPKDRRRELTMRPGGERFVLQLALAAERFGIHVDGSSPEDMQASLEADAALASIEIALTVAIELVRDMRFKLKGTLWKRTLASYSHLAREAKHLPAILPEIAGIRAFLKKPDRSRPPVDPGAGV